MDALRWFGAVVIGLAVIEVVCRVVEDEVQYHSRRSLNEKWNQHFLRSAKSLYYAEPSLN